MFPATLTRALRAPHPSHHLGLCPRLLLGISSAGTRAPGHAPDHAFSMMVPFPLIRASSRPRIAQDGFWCFIHGRRSCGRSSRKVGG